tara:strand:+ start:1067 stop:2122 length:1056 start_codon:yes stop_codon:yes gene_type:complete
MNLKELLTKTVEENASDLHITVGSPPRIRKGGKLVPVSDKNLSIDDTKKIIESELSETNKEKLNNKTEVDYSISVPGVSRFRVNVFNQRGNWAAAYRRLPYEIPSIDSLGLPQAVINLTKRRKGLVLITGTTGSGKSTTLASIIYKITQELEGNIITIEDPIEYLYPHSKAQVNQREVGVDTESFASGLKSALRQDPDVVVVGELRDMESMAAAITIAETGHLVLGTLHTNTASGTINRLVDAFPADKQDVIRGNISMSLLAVVAQQLVPNKIGERSLATEVLISTPAIQSLIRENNIHQIDNYIKSGRSEGMIRMDDSLLELFKMGEISSENTLKYSIDQKAVKIQLESM